MERKTREEVPVRGWAREEEIEEPDEIGGIGGEGGPPGAGGGP